MSLGGLTKEAVTFDHLKKEKKADGSSTFYIFKEYTALSLSEARLSHSQYELGSFSFA